MAAEAISSIWYSAWADAGAPDLPITMNHNIKGSKNGLVRFFQDLLKDQLEHVEDDQSQHQQKLK